MIMGALGLRSKPQLCSLCPQAPASHGFCPGWYPRNPRLALLLEGPGEQEVLYRTPLSGRTGDLTFYSLLRPLGLTRDDVLIDNVLRCRMDNNGYPEGTTRVRAERCCRQYDWYHGGDAGQLLPGGLADWSPEVFVITLHPASIFRENAYFFLVKRDFEKAARLAGIDGSGGPIKRRVCILCGDAAAGLLFPAVLTSGGVGFWRGHVFEGSMKTVEKPMQTVAVNGSLRLFKPASWAGRAKRRKSAAIQSALVLG